MNKKDIQPIVLSVVALLLFGVAFVFTVVAVGFTIKDNLTASTDTPSSLPSEEVHSEQPTALPSTDFNGNWVLSYGSKKIKAEDVTFLGDVALSGVTDCPSFKDSNEHGRILTGVSGSISLATVMGHHLTDGSDASGKTLSEWLAEKQPAVLFLLLGSDIAGTSDEESFSLAYNALIDTVTAASPETVVICSSLFPSALSEGKEVGENTQRVNGWIYQISGKHHEENKNICFFNSYDLLKDENGYLDSRYLSDDGLSSDGYTALFDELTACALPK